MKKLLYDVAVSKLSKIHNPYQYRVHIETIADEFKQRIYYVKEETEIQRVVMDFIKEVINPF